MSERAKGQLVYNARRRNKKRPVKDRMPIGEEEEG